MHTYPRVTLLGLSDCTFDTRCKWMEAKTKPSAGGAPLQRWETPPTFSTLFP